MQSTNLQHPWNAVTIATAFFFLTGLQPNFSSGQDQSAVLKAEGQLVADVSIEIPDEPKTVDPATLVPTQLAAKVTVKFDGQPLKAVFTWLQRDQSINVLVDYKALAYTKLLVTDPVSDELTGAPIYLLLNRLESIGLAWYQQGDVLQITSRAEYVKHDATVPYHLGDLIDAGYPPQELVRTITRCSGGDWDGQHQLPESGRADLIGDVVFVRQTDDIHREIAGLLSAIRQHGRRTFTLDAPQNDAVRLALDKKVTVDFEETPLIVAVQDLARQAGINIRLDQKSPIRERTSVSLKLSDQKLSAVLRSLLSVLDLTWYVRDDVLWIATAEAASQFQKTAVYDVRDLCRDQNESIALEDAIQKQTRAQWNQGAVRNGVIEAPKPGILVVRHTENALDEVLQLLENYRTALRASKSRVVAVPQLDPTEVVAGYYRLPRPMANDLRGKLPKLILPDTWQSIERPDAVGTIQEISVDAKGGLIRVPTNLTGSDIIMSENLVLVIRQTRQTHQLIGKLIQTLASSETIDSKATADTSKKPAKPSSSFGSRLIRPTAQ